MYHVPWKNLNKPLEKDWCDDAPHVQSSVCLALQSSAIYRLLIMKTQFWPLYYQI